MNAIQGSSEIPTVETPIVEPFDEFKRSDDNIIEMKKAEEKAPIKPPKDMLLNDMTIEQLRNVVINLMTINKDYEERARMIQKIWNSKEQVKARYFMLRDNPKAKGVKVV